MNKKESPLIIGGVGGSGTRVVCQIAMDNGFFMGTNLNPALDSLDFQPFYDNWIQQFLVEKELSIITKNEMKKVFDDCLSKHLSTKEMLNIKWGIKNPRFILVLPFLHSLFPEMKFLHVIRDGRDMSFSRNLNQVQLYGDLFCRNEQPGTPLYNLEYWSIVNQNAFAYGSSQLKNNYLIVRFEDIVNNSTETVTKIFRFLENETNNITEIIKKIKTPTTLGRWKIRKGELDKMSKFEKDSLARFGYF